MRPAFRESVLVRRLLGIALCTLIGLAAAVAGLRAAGDVRVAGATSLVIVDSPKARIGDAGASSEDLDALARRTVLLGDVLTSGEGLDYLGRRSGIDPQQISGVTRVTANVPVVMTEPDSER